MRNTQVDSLFSLDREGVLLIHFFFLNPFLWASQLTWEQCTNEIPLVALRCSMEKREEQGEQRGKRGEGSGRDSMGLRGGGEVQTWKGKDELREFWEKGKEGLIKGWGKGRGEDRGVQGKEIWHGLMQQERGQSTIQLATTGLSPRHCQPDNGLISLLFTPVWLTGRNGRKRRGRERVRPCTSPVNVREWARHLDEPHGLCIHHWEKWAQFKNPL